MQTYSFNEKPYVTIGKSPDTEICVNWLTDSATPSVLYYGTAPEILNNSSENQELTFVHHICLTNPAPGKTYYYSTNSSGFSQTFSFTAPANQGKYTFLVLGDMQPLNDDDIQRCKTSLYALQNETFDFWIQLGDFTNRGSIAENWHNSFLSVADYSPYSIMASVPGNHDQTYDDGYNWRNVFPYPYVSDIAKYYFFDYGQSRFIMLDNFEDSDAMSDGQLDWLERILASTPGDYFKFVFFHLSIFSTGDENMYFNLQQKLVPLFDRYRVTAVFYGHDHMYEHYIYKYGNNGLLHSPDHTWPHNEVHYFLAGGGGALLEYEYNLTNRAPFVYTRTWYDENKGDFTEKEYIRFAWNDERIVTWANPEYSPDGNNYYHIPSVESYQTEAENDGLEYGETTLHYLKVEVAGDTCTISARYPDGTLLSGPQKNHPQVWTFTRNSNN